MKNLWSINLVLVLLATSVFAEEPKSGPQPGGFLAPFNVVKCGGATEDGVEVGEELCYRSRNGQKPQVMVFARDAGQVAELGKKLDAWAEKTKSKGRAFICVLGESKKVATDNAKKFAEKAKFKHVAVVVPKEFKNGPERYKIHAKSKHTIILARRGKVVANFQVEDALKPKLVQKIAEAVEKQLGS